MPRAVKCTGVIAFHSSEPLDFPTTLGGLPCFCCMFHFTLINLVHISYFAQKTCHQHPHCTIGLPQHSDHPAALFLHPSLCPSLCVASPTASSRILVWTVSLFYFLGQKVEEKLGLDIILINGTFKTTSRLLFFLTAD